MIITELAVFKVRKHCLELIEIAEETTLENVQKKTEAEFFVSKNLKTF